MGYCSTAEAVGYIGETISEELLGAAHSIINDWTDLRWETTTETEKLYSGDGQPDLFVPYPIIAITSIYEKGGIGETFTALTEDLDFDVEKDIGRIHRAGSWLKGRDNVKITFSHGEISATPKIKFIEAAIAAHLKRNPLLIGSIQIGRTYKGEFDKSAFVAGQGTAGFPALAGLLRQIPQFSNEHV